MQIKKVSGGGGGSRKSATPSHGAKAFDLDYKSIGLEPPKSQAMFVGERGPLMHLTCSVHISTKRGDKTTLEEVYEEDNNRSVNQPHSSIITR